MRVAHQRIPKSGIEIFPGKTPVGPITPTVTLFDPPIATTSAERRASANFIANRSALAITQPSLGQSLLPPREQVEWVFGRDGSLTARDESGNWWAGCSIPFDAGQAMLKRMDVHAPVACFLAPPHAGCIKIALERLSPEQAVIAVIPEEADLRMALACDDFSQELLAHRLWLVAGPAWSEVLDALLSEQIGLAVPAQFLRLHATEESLVQKLIGEATAVFSRITNLRSQQVRELNQGFIAPPPGSQKLCVMSPSRFQLWNGEGRVLAAMAPTDSLLLDTSDPSTSSPLKLAITACECGALLAPNFARADLPDVIPGNVPWFTWVTNARVPAFERAGPYDHLLATAPSVQTTAIAAGWPADRVHVAAWPQLGITRAKETRELTVLADTMPVMTPDDLEGFSSHRVLWETIQGGLSKDPFSLNSDPASYLAAQMRRFDVSDDAFPHERFVTKLIVPAYQQGVVRGLLAGGLPLRLYGEGWGDISEFESFAAGAANSQADLEMALGSATILVDLWPWRAAHPIGSAIQPVLRREGRGMAAFIQHARKILSTHVPPTVQQNPSLSPTLLGDLLKAVRTGLAA